MCESVSVCICGHECVHVCESTCLCVQVCASVSLLLPSLAPGAPQSPQDIGVPSHTVFSAFHWGIPRAHPQVPHPRAMCGFKSSQSSWRLVLVQRTVPVCWPGLWSRAGRVPVDWGGLLPGPHQVLCKGPGALGLQVKMEELVGG